MYEGTDTGFISQNVYLYCASERLATCVLGSLHRDKLQELFKYNGKAILGQGVGVAQ
jgi:nitroreductase